MAAEYTLKYTGKELAKLLASVEALAAKVDASMLTIKDDDTDNGKILRVVDGKWTAVAIDVYNGEVL
jgi:hypothetical protein